MYNEIIDGRVVTRCSRCGEEIKSLIHRCFPLEIQRIRIMEHPNTTNEGDKIF